jgi:HEAT repeat protein
MPDAGGSPDLDALAEHFRRAATRYLARYLASATSPREAARLAAGEYIARRGAVRVVARLGRARPGSPGRTVALYALSRAGHAAALPALEEALRSPRPVQAYAALDMLDVHGTAGAAEVLLRALDDGVLPASRIATQLEHFAIDLTDAYVARLSGGNAKSRYWMAYLLGRTHYGERSARVLEGLLADPAADVRKAALASLAALDAPGVEAHAERSLDDPVFYVRTQAARILARFPAPRVVHALARRLADEHDAVQLAAKRSLVELGGVTLEHLPAVAPRLDEVARGAIPEIANTIRQASGRGDVRGLDAPACEVAHGR